MADSMNYKDWYYKANQDLKAADILFKAEESEGDHDYSISSFLCQQCIEKYLKGYILKNTGNLFDGHNLVHLCRNASEIDSTFKRFREGCSYVSEFYIEPRYPADMLFIKKVEAEDCLKFAREIAEYILELEQLL